MQDKYHEEYTKAPVVRREQPAEVAGMSQEQTNKPDDAVLFDLLEKWAPNEATCHRILVENPEVLYGFGRNA